MTEAWTCWNMSNTARFFSKPALAVFALGFTFNVTAANIAGQLQLTENDRETSSETVYREVLQRF